MLGAIVRRPFNFAVQIIMSRLYLCGEGALGTRILGFKSWHRADTRRQATGRAVLGHSLGKCVGKRPLEPAAAVP